MKPGTAASLSKLESVEWFRAVGQPLDPGPDVATVSSWVKAIGHCASSDWENVQLEAANRHTEILRQRSPARFKEWNATVEQVRPEVVRLVEAKTAGVVAREDMPRHFVASVRWDILHFAMECEYADVLPPAFYASLSYWYFEGRFPCGWEGNLPGEAPPGHLLIY